MINQNINLGLVQKLMEEIQIFETQPRQHYELAGCCLPDGHFGNSNPPSQSFYLYSSCYPYTHTNYSSDWEISEAVKIQELEEVKARAAQMEKTMQWWSDCTANWREKWSKVRGERNKAQEEARQLRIKLDNVMKELSMLRKINQDLVSEKRNLEDATGWKTEFSCSDISYIKKDLNQLAFLEQEPVNELSKINKIHGTEDTKVKNGELFQDVFKDQSNCNQKITPKPPSSFPNVVPSTYLEEHKKSLNSTAETTENDLIHVSALHLQLADMKKILRKEREMNAFLEKEMENIENELYHWKWKYEELHQTKLESLKQLERLQFKNTSGWRKREIPEAEKQSLEEENRSLKLQSRETEESKLRIWDQTKLFGCCWKVYQESE
ncbi:coiled-coil domain-containing protein 102B [Melopsittacus undulatus]|uniref:coiled-coil domain-containing protein 102B n=1 Tax=Melopsittacus undulatus TaxID=13146 RepID=UPI001469AE32|nr:coiled-coil domain-containing protein 102B [Melopsittacus undulatus]